VKNKIKELLLENGIDEKSFKVAKNNKATKSDRFRGVFRSANKDCKYYILCIEDMNIILLWEANKCHTVCTAPKKSVYDAIENHQKFVLTNDQFSGWGKIEAHISNPNEILSLIKNLEKSN